MNETDSLDCIRHIAKSVIAKHAPEEMRYFNIIWKRFTKDDFFDKPSSRTSILTFAEHNDLSLFGPTTLTVLKVVLLELRTKIKKPSLDKLKNAIHACAVELGAPNDTVLALEHDLSIQVHENLVNLIDSVDDGFKPKSSQKHTLIVNSANDIRIDGRKITFDSSQACVLLCELIREECLHWSIAYILFPKWIDVQHDKVRKRLIKLTHKINMKKYDPGLKTELTKDRYGKPEYIRLKIHENTKVSGNIIEANHFVQEAMTFIKKGNYSEAMKRAVSAYQKDPDSLDAMFVVSEIAVHIDYDLPTALIYIQQRLYSKMTMLIKIERIIKTTLLSSDLNDASLNPVLSRCREEITKIDRASESFAKAFKSLQYNLTADDYEFYYISTTLQKMASEQADFNDLFMKLCLNHTIAEIIEKIQIGLSKKRIKMDRTEVLTKLESFIREKALSIPYQNLSHLKGYWIKTLVKGIAGESITSSRYFDENIYANDFHNYDDEPDL